MLERRGQEQAPKIERPPRPDHAPGYQLSETDRRRNPHCSNCGSTRGGPMGHEISECTWDSRSAQAGVVQTGPTMTSEPIDILAALADVPPQPRSMINAWHNQGGRVIE